MKVQKADRFGHARSHGSSLAIMVVLMVTLMGFLGVAIYTGLNAYLQNELQNATSTAAGAGARAFYDTFNASGVPQKSPNNAMTAARNTFDNVVSANGTLTTYGVKMINGTPKVNTGQDTVTIESQAVVPTPFLSLVGINDYRINAKATAKYAVMVVNGNLFTIDTKAGPYYKLVTLNHPILDGPGPDLIVGGQPSGGGWHGVMVELCSNGKCYDIDNVARTAPSGNSGIIADRNYPGYGTRRVLYGWFNFDLGGTGPGYNANVKKGAALRIVDDGVHDYINPTTKARGLELNPAPTRINTVVVGHNAVFCPNETQCAQPPGFQFYGPPLANLYTYLTN